ncbi:translesion error-prone DNA polymerase V subunit UmuC [Rheinheimera hassiensis]|uniref:translesion error-prone DNA polymerase V subunit UmuC n=1 Tax=Rheinheimera hassiensis TaxID=1193627 RepID=UPI001F0693D5|nr:translesion error-prone DNA polymerase V subunit UmuC [Rheinheimera hassiensis]
MFGLCDCNNFYASCEKLFKPALANRPVIVLSNNDGCVVARSREAKQLGIKMGVPAFQIQNEIRKHRIEVFSSNYALYGDMSARVMSTIRDMVPALEVYSIDECFVDLSGCGRFDLTEFGKDIKSRVAQYTGIAICVGIAPTKTLAKLANFAAKKWSATGGVVDLSDSVRQRKLLSLIPVDEIWGIGRQLTKRLNDIGIKSGLDFADTPAKLLRQQFSVVLERTHREINGESCIELEDAPPTKKQIVCSRAFGERVTIKRDMNLALAEHVSRACKKLRQEKQKARVISIFITTGHFSNDPVKYSQNRSAELTYPSDDTRDFLHLASLLLDAIWLDGPRYAKCGVMLMDFYDQSVVQGDLFAAAPVSNQLMSLVDRINSTGSGQISFASAIGSSSHAMRRERLSPAYTTKLSELPIAK